MRYGRYPGRDLLLSGIMGCMLVVYSPFAHAQPVSLPVAEPAKKRVEPAKVAPLVLGRVRYEVVPWGTERGLAQDSGVIRAVDVRSGVELWLLTLFVITPDPDLEADKQEDFIVRLRPGKVGQILATTERGRRYRVDVERRTVEKLPAIR